MKRRFGKRIRKKQEIMEVDITSLLDILVILLVFLLKSYNPSDLKLDLVDNLKLPESKSRSLGSGHVMVQVNQKKEIFVANELIGSLDDSSPEKITVLFEKLEDLKKIEDAKLEEVIARTPDSQEQIEAMKKKDVKKVNIVLHQDLPYATMRKVMNTAALAGYPEFKFIVKGNF